MATTRTAIALTGIGGNNAFGAGFLAAAQDVARRLGQDDGLLPGLEMITCTSGAIASAAGYLRGDDLRADVEHAVDKVIRSTLLPKESWAEPVRLPIILGWTGLPGIFAPYWLAVAEHLVAQALDFISSGRPPMATPVDLVNTFLPARMFIPERPKPWFVKVARTFNDSSIGVAFNSYDPSTGTEHLYVNEPGMALIREHHDPAAAYGSSKDRTVYGKITPDAVEHALWLLWYGFDTKDRRIDGSYARSIILNEATFADRILAVKPVNDRWDGPLPQNVFEVLDMLTELWLGSTYREQRQQIDLVNNLVDRGRIAADASDGGTAKKYHRVDLVPVELPRHRGLFSHFVEDLDVFDSSRTDATAALETLLGLAVTAG